MADKYLPPEVSDKEHAAMEAAGEIPPAKVRAPGYWTGGRLENRPLPKFDVLQGEEGGETPEQTLQKIDAEIGEIQARLGRPYTPSESPTPVHLGSGTSPSFGIDLSDEGMSRHNMQQRIYDLKAKVQKLEREFFTTGADDPTRPTRTELPTSDEEVKAHRDSAAKKALEKP